MSCKGFEASTASFNATLQPLLAWVAAQVRAHLDAEGPALRPTPCPFAAARALLGVALLQHLECERAEPRAHPVGGDAPRPRE